MKSGAPFGVPFSLAPARQSPLEPRGEEARAKSVR
jgi:hypothetical protein